MYCGGDDIGAIVADIGSFSARIGFAGDDVPRSNISTSVGVSVDSTGEERYHYDSSKFRENMAIENLVTDGIISDWNMLENMWGAVSANALKVNPRETPVLFTEKPYNAPANRHRTCELFFEKFESPAFFMAKDAVLECYACGRTSGLVVDCGSSGTTISPISDGWIEAKGVMRSKVGGQCMDKYLLNVLRKKMSSLGKPLLPLYKVTKTVFKDRTAFIGPAELKNIDPSFDAQMNLDLARDVKETICRLAEITLNDQDPRFTSTPMMPYELPDGTTIDFGIERFGAPELLFDATPVDAIMPLDAESLKNIPRLICDSSLRCEADSQAQLLANIILAGGASCFEGLPERLRVEVEQIVHVAAPSWKVRTMAGGLPERAICSWLGGSILASLGSFHEMWISKQEYEEFGAAIVDKKCP